MSEAVKLSASEEHTLGTRGYKLVKKLGEGSYAKVYMAEYTTPGGSDTSTLACKIIDTEKAPKDFVRKFLPRELAILVRLNHPHIIHVHSIFQRRSKYYIFMRCAELGDILDFVLKNGAVAECQARVWFRQIALAIQYLHELEVAHRDLKCENILITSNFNVKVADFGFARDVVDARGKRVLSETYCGSLSYAAPEILVGAPYNPKIADVWATGVVLYVMLNKAMPFDDAHVKRLYDQQVSRKWKFRAKVADVLSDQLKSLMSNLLEPEVNKRWRMDHVIVSDWIAMDERLLKMTFLESEAYRSAAEERQRRFETLDDKVDLRNKQLTASTAQRQSASILLKAAEQAASGKGADVNVIKDVKQAARSESPESHSVAEVKKKDNYKQCAMLRCLARHAAFLAPARLKSYVAPNQVYHDPLRRKFIVRLLGNDRGFVAYKSLGENIWQLFYTEVPPEYRRLGVGSTLAGVVLDHCAERNIRVRITCSFLVSYYLAHKRPEYERIVLKPKG